MKPLSLNQTNFGSTIDNARIPVLVDFWAEWCGPCKMLAPVLDELAIEQSDRSIIAKVNIDEAPELAAQFGVTSIPTLMIFQNGRPARTLVGVQSRKEISRTLAAFQTA